MLMETHHSFGLFVDVLVLVVFLGREFTRPLSTYFPTVSRLEIMHEELPVN